jgi:hypothetical protein
VRTIEVWAELHVSALDRTIDVSANGSHVRAEVSTLAIRRPTLRLVVTGALALRRLASVLGARGLRLTVSHAGRDVIDLGAGVRAHPIARLLGCSYLRVNWN